MPFVPVTTIDPSLVKDLIGTYTFAFFCPSTPAVVRSGLMEFDGQGNVNDWSACDPNAMGSMNIGAEYRVDEVHKQGWIVYREHLSPTGVKLPNTLNFVCLNNDWSVLVLSNQTDDTVPLIGFAYKISPNPTF